MNRITGTVGDMESCLAMSEKQKLARSVFQVVER